MGCNHSFAFVWTQSLGEWIELKEADLGSSVQSPAASCNHVAGKVLPGVAAFACCALLHNARHGSAAPHHTVPSASAHTASRRQICRDLLHWQTRKRREIVLLGMCACPGTGNLDKPTCPSTSLPQSSLPVIMQFSRVHTCRAHVSIVCSFTVPSVLLLHRVASPPPANSSLARLMHHRPACGLVVVCTGVNK